MKKRTISSRLSFPNRLGSLDDRAAFQSNVMEITSQWGYNVGCLVMAGQYQAFKGKMSE